MFEVRERYNGEPFTTLADGAPDWLYEACREAHCGEVPNDWRWDACRSICEQLVERCGFAGVSDPLSDDDVWHEVADGLVDVYTSDRLRWLADNLERVALVDEAHDEYGWSTDQGVAGLIGTAQYLTLRDMCETIGRAMADNYGEYVEACEAEELEAHTVPAWWVHGCPGGPLG